MIATATRLHADFGFELVVSSCAMEIAARFSLMLIVLDMQRRVFGDEFMRKFGIIIDARAK